MPSALLSGVNVLPFPRARLMRLTGRLMAPFVTTARVLRANARALRVPADDLDGYLRAARTLVPGRSCGWGRSWATSPPRPERPPRAAGCSSSRAGGSTTWPGGRSRCWPAHSRTVVHGWSPAWATPGAGRNPGCSPTSSGASVADRPLPAVLTEVPGAAPDTGDGQRPAG